MTIRDTSAAAHYERQISGTAESQAVTVLREYWRRWEDMADGLTDYELGLRLDVGLDEDKPWKASSVSSARGKWIECRGVQKGCDTAHEEGQTHSGERPYLMASEDRRKTDTDNLAIVWMPTEYGQAQFDRITARGAP